MGVTAVELTAEAEAGAGERARLVVGTEAALHRLSHADLVALLDFDQHLLAPRFTASEEALGLVARAARLLGPRERGGRLLIQTRLPDHDAVRAAAHADVHGYVRVVLRPSERAVPFYQRAGFTFDTGLLVRQRGEAAG